MTLKYTGLHLKRFRITIFVNTEECRQRFITRPTFMHLRYFRVSFRYVYANETSMLLLWWVFTWGKCLPNESGSFLMTKFEHLCVN